MDKDYIFYIFIILLFIFFIPIFPTQKSDICVKQESRTEEASLSYTETNKHENTITDKISSGDTSTYIKTSIYNQDSDDGNFLVVATFSPIANLDMSLLNQLTKGTINLDSKILKEEKRSATVFIPSHSTRDVKVTLDNPFYQVSKHEIIPPKKTITITEQVDFQCQRQVYVTFLDKMLNIS